MENNAEMRRYLDIKNETDFEKLDEAIKVIKNGGVVLFPTETVYGIGANGLSSEAVEKVFKAKGRSTKNPINLLVSSKEMVESIAKDITELEYKLMEAFFPGAFTIILNKKENVPDIVTAGGSTVGVRMSSSKITTKLVEMAGVPIAAPSANLSGKPSGTNINDIIEEFKGKVDYIIDGGESEIGIESTIVKVVDGIPHILRPGAITDTQIEKVAGKVILDYLDSEKNKSLPSNNLEHYKIKTKCILVDEEDIEENKTKLLELANKYDNSVIICSNESANFICSNKSDGFIEKDITIFNMGAKDNLEEVSRNIFKLLRKADDISPYIIIIEGVEKKRNRKSYNG